MNPPRTPERLRTRILDAMSAWHPTAQQVRRFEGRLRATVGRVRADRRPLTLVTQSGAAMAEAASLFEACAHRLVLECYARAASSEEVLRYCRLLRDVLAVLGGAAGGARASREESAGGGVGEREGEGKREREGESDGDGDGERESARSDEDRALASLRLAGRTMGAIAAAQREDPLVVDARLMALAERDAATAAIAALALEMLAEVRGETVS